MKRKATLFIVLMIILLYGTIVYAEDFSISQTKATINVGETVDLNISGTDKAAVWTSYNANTAKVNQKGEVTALKAGKATIRVRAGLKCKTCQVTVVNAGIKINKTSAVLYCGGNPTGTLQLKATAKGTTKNVSWKSSDAAIATVDNNGKVNAVSSGNVIITAMANGMKAECNVTVRESSVSLNCNTVYLNTKGVGSKITLTPCVVGAKNKVVWTSSDKNVAAVSGGKITAKKAGKAIITATANGLSDKCEVIVDENAAAANEPITSIFEDTVYLKTRGSNKTYTLGKTVIGATNKITWTSSNKNVAAVSNGKLTAKSAGTAVVTATANGKSDTVTVVVEDFAPTIKLNQMHCTLYTGKGNKASLKATIDGKNKKATWKSSDTGVVTVSNGKLTAVAAGTAIVTAEANGVSASCNVSVLETEVDLSSTQLNLAVGETADIIADVTGLSSKVKWSSTVSKTATVKNGVITAKKAGETDIKATANGVTAVCHVIVADKCDHQYDEGVVRKAATCTSVGSMVYTCKLCGSNYNEPTKIAAHQYKDTVVSPTCEQNGYTEHVCTLCGDSYKDSETEALGHKMGLTSSTPATCITLGSEVYTCEVCGKTETKDLPLIDHIYGEWQVIKQATTSAEGTRQRVCTVCGHADEEAVPVLPEGHVHDYKETRKEATCTEDGYVEYKCDCGDSYKEGIPALGHKEGSWTVKKEATCEEAGSEEVKCTVCGKTLNTRGIPSSGHQTSRWTVRKKSTCTELGVKVKICSVCGKEVETGTIPMAEHQKSEWTVVTEASCGKTGSEKIYCTVCNLTLDTRTISAKEHSYKTVTADATCTEPAVETKTCIYCGDTETKTTAPSLGHDEDGWQTGTEATCTAGGTEVKLCKRCGEQIDKRDTAPLGHDFKAGEVTAPTCSSGGYTTYECTRCGNTEQRDETDKLEHQAGDWHTITEATCNSPEIQGITCILCGETLETRMPTPTVYGDHGYEVEQVVAPTPCERGYTIYRCRYCRATKSDDYVPATGKGVHEWDYDNYIQQSENYFLVPCKICGHKKVMQSLEQIQQKKQEQLDDEKAVQQVTKVIGEIIRDDMTDVEKIYAVNDWICRNCEYDEETYKWVMQQGGILFSCDVTEARGVMLHGKAVCSGYAKAFKEFMDQLGIDCKIVRSDMMNHAWNQVRLNDGWYWLDVTHNDTNNKKGFFFMDYFLLTEKRTHNYQTVTDEEGGEVCSGTKHLKGTSMFEKYSVEMEDDINELYQLQENNDTIFFKVDSLNSNITFLEPLHEEYSSLYGEAFVSGSMKLPNNLGYVLCIKNTDNVREFFENRISSNETVSNEEDNNATEETSSREETVKDEDSEASETEEISESNDEETEETDEETEDLDTEEFSDEETETQETVETVTEENLQTQETAIEETATYAGN